MVKRFLLIDDDVDDRELFSEALASVSPAIKCDLAADAEEALHRLYAKDLDIAKNLGALCFITKPNAFNKLQETLTLIVSYSNRQLYHLLCSAIDGLKN